MLLSVVHNRHYPLIVIADAAGTTATDVATDVVSSDWFCMNFEYA
jgi:hypothetical protein